MADTNHSSRDAAVTVLAVIGFLGLVLAGILLAIYAANYIPVLVSKMKGGNEAALTTVPADSLPLYTASSTDTTSTSTDAVVATSTDTSTATADTSGTSGNSGYTYTPPVHYQPVVSQYYSPGATPIQLPPVYTGKADLTVTIVAVGYINRNGDFVAANHIDRDQEMAAQILVSNIGTNQTGNNWEIRVTLPTQSNSNFTITKSEPNLEPGGILPLVVSLTKGNPERGNNETIKAEVDIHDDVNESNERNNTARADIDVR